MAKEILEMIKLLIPAGGAIQGPPVGPALGQRGLNIGEFVKQFNDRTKNLEKNAPIPVLITAYKDRTFKFVTKLPPVSHYLKKAAKIASGSGEPHKEKVATITKSQVMDIVKIKKPDLNTEDDEAAARIIASIFLSFIFFNLV